jgi:hypothetical protein
VLDLQADMARSIANQIKLSLRHRGRGQLAQRRPVDPAVLDLYLQGCASLDSDTEDRIHKGMESFEQALAQDPSDAPAEAVLALAYGWVTPDYAKPKDVMPKSREHAQRAIEHSKRHADKGGYGAGCGDVAVRSGLERRRARTQACHGAEP